MLKYVLICAVLVVAGAKGKPKVVKEKAKPAEQVKAPDAGAESANKPSPFLNEDEYDDDENCLEKPKKPVKPVRGAKKR
jgi:hypothetical protein